MIEQQKDIIRFKDKDAGFYFNRFIRGTQLIMAIDDGAFGNGNWWTGSNQDNGEGTFMPLLPVNICERKDITNPMTGQRQRGLRFGVQRGAIWGSYRWLCEHGFKDEVNMALEHIRESQGRGKAEGEK